MRRGADSRLARAHDGGCVQDTCKTHARHLQDICKTRARRASETRPVCVRTETRCNGVLKLFVNYSGCSLTKSSDTPLQRVSVRTQTGRVSDARLARVLQMSCRCLACVLHASCTQPPHPFPPLPFPSARRQTACVRASAFAESVHSGSLYTHTHRLSPPTGLHQTPPDSHTHTAIDAPVVQA